MVGTLQNIWRPKKIQKDFAGASLELFDTPVERWDEDADRVMIIRILIDWMHAGEI